MARGRGKHLLPKTAFLHVILRFSWRFSPSNTAMTSHCKTVFWELLHRDLVLTALFVITDGSVSRVIQDILHWKTWRKKTSVAEHTGALCRQGWLRTHGRCKFYLNNKLHCSAKSCEEIKLCMLCMHYKRDGTSHLSCLLGTKCKFALLHSWHLAESSVLQTEILLRRRGGGGTPESRFSTG